MKITANWSKNLESLINDKVKLNRTLNKIGNVMLNETMLRFSTETDPNNRKWKPIKRKHIKNEKGILKKYGGKILNDSGDLKRSINMKVRNDSVIVGTNKEYARIHNEGGVIERNSMSRLKFTRKQFLKDKKTKIWSKTKRKVSVSQFTTKKYSINIPKRQFLGFNNKMLGKIRNIIDKEVSENIISK